jgi:uncharacterized protein
MIGKLALAITDCPPPDNPKPAQAPMSHTQHSQINALINWKAEIQPPCAIAVHAIPKSAKNGVEGWEVDAAGARWLRVRITAAPEDGKATAALIKLLAKELGCAKSALQLVQGATSRYKRFDYHP